MSNIYWYIRDGKMRFRRALTVLPAIALLFLVDACTTTQQAVRDEVSVEGVVSVRGNEPFTELVLQTPDRNYYVLKFADPAERSRMQNAAPASFAVTGEVYRGEWGGRAYAHLRVQEWQPVSSQN